MATINVATTLKNARADAITTFAGNGALIKYYTGTIAATPQTAISGQTLLATDTCGTPFAPAASAGVLTANSITSGTAVATGTATWARITKSDGTTVIADVDVGTSAATIILNSVSIISGGTVAISSFTFTEA